MHIGTGFALFGAAVAEPIYNHTIHLVYPAHLVTIELLGVTVQIP
jgi:hypothetical protein